ncbi:MAG: DUF58 domain-containing protein [Lachnospiraceae bacterium]|nr:DUF58 domain-containing protein [Lachnospiraceae bacterium]
MRLFIAVIVVIILYSIQSLLYRRHWNLGLNIQLSFSKDIANVGEQVILTEVIENKKALPLPILHVKFRTSRTFSFADTENSQTTDHYYRNDVFSVLGKQKVTRTLPFVTTHRGYFTITELHITSKDLFLTTTFADMLPNHAALYVFPSRLPLVRFAAIHEQMLGDFHTRRQSLNDPFAFYGIRPYQSYDSMRSINWKATAHTGALMVNQFEPATSNEVCIFLNLTPYMKARAESLSEHAINIANTIGTTFIEDKVDVSLCSNACDILTGKQAYLPAGHSQDHKLSLSRTLSRIDLNQTCNDFMELLKSHIKEENHPVSYILISTYRDDALFSYFERHAEDHSMYWIIPEFSHSDIHFQHAKIIKWEL